MRKLQVDLKKEYKKTKEKEDMAKEAISSLFAMYDSGKITKSEYHRRRIPFLKIIGTFKNYYKEDGSLRV